MSDTDTIVTKQAEIELQAASLAAAWFVAHAASTPWRRNHNPWPVLVSEIMLQQTRVETVRRYFDPFLQHFPHPESLVPASEAELLDAWRGLGYYRRVRSLQKAALMICEHFGGQIPDSPTQLATLPGVGSYTSRAVAAIAFGRPTLPVDGNIARVLARITGHRKATRTLPQAADRRWSLALAEVDSGAAVQALMEIGSTICLPAAPRCAHCPFANFCKAASSGQAERYGRSETRRPPVMEEWHAFAGFTAEGRLLLVQRPAGLLGNQWALPMLTPEQAATIPLPTIPAGSSRHTFTHRRWHTFLHISDPLPETAAPLFLACNSLRFHWCSHPRQCVISRAFEKMLDTIARHRILSETPCNA